LKVGRPQKGRKKIKRGWKGLDKYFFHIGQKITTSNISIDFSKTSI
jgi:hypothetical protein